MQLCNLMARRYSQSGNPNGTKQQLKLKILFAFVSDGCNKVLYLLELNLYLQS